MFSERKVESGGETMNLPQLDLENIQGPKAIIETNHGKIVVQLFEKQAPKTVENFIGLAKEGYYNETIFHRVISDFMIQGGDPNGDGTGGESIWGGNFEDEFSDELFNIRGALSMANAGPNTNGSQFFIVQNKNMPKRYIREMAPAGYPKEIIKRYKQGGTPWLDQKHTVFGQVIEGMDVVDEIAKVPRNKLNDKPKEDFIVEKVTIEDN